MDKGHSNPDEDAASSTGELGGGGGGAIAIGGSAGGASSTSAAVLPAAAAASTTTTTTATKTTTIATPTATPAPRSSKAKPPKKRSRASDEAPASGGDAKTSGGAAGGASSSGTSRAANTSGGGVKKRKPRRAGSGVSNDANNTNAASSTGTTAASVSAAQAAAVRDQMRRALEEDQYSANGSIVDTDSDSDVGGGGGMVEYHGTVLRIDRPSLMQYAKEYMSLLGGGAGSAGQADGSHSASAAGGIGTGTALSASASGGAASKKGKDKGTRASNASSTGLVGASAPTLAAAGGGTASDSVTKELDDELDLDGGSIFGQTTGSSNFTWVCCDRCKKWRRLRGVVDEKKLPSKWYCSMNKNDPERNRCSAPEEEYDTNHSTPESAADARCRKHLRVWVRRLQCNETYEARQPTMTRGKKKAQSSSKEPYEWIRCCNPSCGKWRSLLRIMEAKSVIEKTQDGEWYCVMNTWDEKVASCAAPQENLPAVGCPLWVLQDESN